MAIDFTTQQKKFLRHPRNEHARLLAGPGTGKSTTIIEYAGLLLRDNITAIRLLTFTRAATAELADSLDHANAATLNPSTIHSFAIALVLRNPGTADVTLPLRIMTDWEWDNLVRPRITKRLKLGKKWRDADVLRREKAAEWESLTPEKDDKVDDTTRAQFTSEWQLHRNLCAYTELSEIPHLLRTGLENHPDFDYGDIELVIVDEYQDLNACDLACLSLLASRGVTVFAVGDDDQSIYRFRKADPAGIRRFCAEYGDAASYPLTIAQRFGKNILRWANYAINFDSGRDDTKLDVTPKAENVDGTVKLLSFAGQVAEAKGISTLVRYLNETQGIPYEQILILGRSGTITKPIIVQLEKDGIVAADPSIIKDALSSNEMQIAFAILRLLSNRADSLAWWTIFKISTGIGETTIEALLAHAASSSRQLGEAILTLRQSGELSTVCMAALDGCVGSKLEQLESIDVPDRAAWGRWILKLSSSGVLPTLPEPVPEYLERIDALLAAQDFSLEGYISQVPPIAKDLSSKRRESAVRVMNMTASKGLTVRACIVAGCESDIVPHPKSDRDEECRLLYVAMTRAREHLYLTWARHRTGQTARVGRPKVQAARTFSPFLEHGPVRSEDGAVYVAGLDGSV